MSKIRRPHKEALFSLIPMEEKAENVVNDQDNQHLVSLSLKDDQKSLDIGFHINNESSINMLATLGRNDCDITLRPKDISKTHCSFEIDHQNPEVVMFCDRSRRRNTRVSGKNSEPFDNGRSPRKILVHPGFNQIISFGGLNGDLIVFKLQWMQNDNKIKTIIKNHLEKRKSMVINPRKALTQDPTDTVIPSAMMTPEQAFQKSSETGVRYHKRECLGGGSFGTVWRVIDVDSGRVMAMKQIDCLPQQQLQARFRNIRREVELMRISNHPNIVDLITSQGWDDEFSSIMIFMAREDDNLGNISADDRFTLASGRPSRCLQQMLSALDFLAYKGIVHRDVKPENILCSYRGLECHFRLSDFGVSKFAKDAHSYQGTKWYMAPEILRLRTASDADGLVQTQQSPKVDVWSLFVTIAYARNVCNYRDRSLNDSNDILLATREACAESWMSQYSDMVIEDPFRRASAFDILQRSFEGVGIANRNGDIEISGDRDYLFINPQLAEATEHARSTLPLRRSMRVYKKCKPPTWPSYMLNRLTVFANEL